MSILFIPWLLVSLARRRRAKMVAFHKYILNIIISTTSKKEIKKKACSTT